MASAGPRACDHCGTRYEARRVTSRYCSTRCRTRASRAGQSASKGLTEDQVVTQLPAAGKPTAATTDLPYGAEQLTITELEQAGRLQTTLGMAAVILARRLDSNQRETGSGAAALARQLEATLKSATAGAKVASDPVQRAKDQLAERRARRGA